jgi:hypothetical protein
MKDLCHFIEQDLPEKLPCFSDEERWIKEAGLRQPIATLQFFRDAATRPTAGAAAAVTAMAAAGTSTNITTTTVHDDDDADDYNHDDADDCEARLISHSVLTCTRARVSRVFTEFDHAWISLFQNLFHPRRAHKVLKKWLLYGARFDDSLQVANCIVGRSFGDRSAAAADSVGIVRVPSRAVRGENLDATERILGLGIISK